MRDTEKNWVFFEHQGQLWTVYQTQPLVAMAADATQGGALGPERIVWNWKAPPNVTLRGGAPPVLPGPDADRFYLFVHSSAYDVYLLTIDRYTLRPLACSTTPILSRASQRCRILFPCGALYDAANDSFLLCVGIDDTRIAFFHHLARESLDSCLETLYNEDTDTDTHTLASTTHPSTGGQSKGTHTPSATRPQA
jgi:hypothetical protein